ncbi:MAG: CDP-alcohol phosphatidyltransferase family protein [Candidatus Woesearchaeota archaeon]
MNLTSKRKVLKKIYSPLAIVLVRIGLSPNQTSIIALLLGILAAYLYLTKNYLWATLSLIFSGIFDLMDGDIAVKTNKMTKFGAVFDWISDKIVDTLVIGAIGLTYANPYITIFAIMGSLINTFVKPVAYSEIGYDFRVKGKIESQLEGVGMFGRPETFITIIMFSILHYFNFLGIINLYLCIIIIAVFTNISLLQRLIYLYRRYNIQDV